MRGGGLSTLNKPSKVITNGIKTTNNPNEKDGAAKSSSGTKKALAKKGHQQDEAISSGKLASETVVGKKDRNVSNSHQNVIKTEPFVKIKDPLLSDLVQNIVTDKELAAALGIEVPKREAECDDSKLSYDLGEHEEDKICQSEAKHSESSMSVGGSSSSAQPVNLNSDRAPLKNDTWDVRGDVTREEEGYLCSEDLNIFSVSVFIDKLSAIMNAPRGLKWWLLSCVISFVIIRKKSPYGTSLRQPRHASFSAIKSVPMTV